MHNRHSLSHLKRHRVLVAGTTFALAPLFLLPLASANLAGSTFEGNDGNLVVNTAGNTDWVNAPNRVRGDDLASGNGDNSFGQGTKEDDPNVTVVTGSIPPNKSDLTRFYVANEFASGQQLPVPGLGARRTSSARRTWTSRSTRWPSRTCTTTGPKTLEPHRG